MPTLIKFVTAKSGSRWNWTLALQDKEDVFYYHQSCIVKSTRRSINSVHQLITHGRISIKHAEAFEKTCFIAKLIKYCSENYDFREKKSHYIDFETTYQELYKKINQIT